MGKNQNSHLDDSNLMPVNQGNQTSEDPGDGNRLTDNPEDIEKTALERKPDHDRQDEEKVEEFGRRGVASADKEA